MKWGSVPWRAVAHWASLLAAAAAAAVAIVALFGPVTDLIARHDVGGVTGPGRGAALETARDAARGRLLTLGAGVFAAGALVYTARNFTLSRRTFELTEQRQVTDRYTKAIEQLGSDKLDVRLGGIYALERVADDSARDHPTIMEVLAAFVREHSHEPWPPSAGDVSGDAPPERRTRPDAQAAVTVLGRRNARHDRQSIDLAGADLTGADLTQANLAYANLGGADLTGADLRWADFTRTVFLDAKLPGARFVHANLARADLTGADLTQAELFDVNLTDANLNGACLTHAHFEGCPFTGWITRLGEIFELLDYL